MNNFTTKECLFQVTLCLETLTGFDVARLLTPFGQNQCLQAKLIPKKKNIRAQLCANEVHFYKKLWLRLKVSGKIHSILKVF